MQACISASFAFALIIGCLGLFGLSAINAANYVKDIGIRKLLGATVFNIVMALVKNLLLIVAISVLIAISVAYWLMNLWLEDFVYRITIEWPIFVLAGCIALFFAAIAVAFHSIKAALVNPVKSLRTE